MRHDGFPARLANPLTILAVEGAREPKRLSTGRDIDAADRAQQGAPLHKTRQNLVHGGPALQVQQLLCDQGRAFWQPGGVFKNLLGQGLRGDNFNGGEATTQFLTVFEVLRGIAVLGAIQAAFGGFKRNFSTVESRTPKPATDSE